MQLVMRIYHMFFLFYHLICLLCSSHQLRERPVKDVTIHFLHLSLSIFLHLGESLFHALACESLNNVFYSCTFCSTMLPISTLPLDFLSICTFCITDIDVAVTPWWQIKLKIFPHAILEFDSYWLDLVRNLNWFDIFNAYVVVLI